MAKKEEKKYYWNLKGQTFAGRQFGEEVTDILADDEDRLQKYLDLGQIVTSEPTDFDQAKESELTSLRIEVEKLQLRNSELETEKKKTPKSTKNAAAKIKSLESKLEEVGDTEKKVEELETQVAELTKQLEEATAPDSEKKDGR